ncbi:MAG TPA: hypothetical protein VMB05_10525 [Solirubrobacteraceae bacterium]|nr:hypothetical protein [Solirubrobacteraceae bacterium]
MAAAGAQDVAQEFTLRLQRAAGLSPRADRLQLKSRLQTLLESLREDPSIEGRSNHVEFLLAWWSPREHKPLALHLFSAGAGEWVDRWAFAGVPLGVEIASFAVGTMRYLDPAELSLEQAQVIALKVLRDTIETGVEGIAGAVQIGVLARDHIRLVTETEMQTLERTVDLWESCCAELLLAARDRS